MIAIKNEQELSCMRQACKITAAARALAGEMVRPGVTTKEIDKAVREFILSKNAKPSFLRYNGFPASSCISVNNVVVHGIPGGYVLKDGDIVTVDVGACWNGFHGDCAATFACGVISTEAQKLIEERGGVCQSSVTAKTTLVLAGEEAGSKLAKAQKLGIKIIDEQTFKEMIEQN